MYLSVFYPITFCLKLTLNTSSLYLFSLCFCKIPRFNSYATLDEVTMFEINPIKIRLADIAERSNVLRGYL